MLEKFGEHGDRVLYVELSKDKKILTVGEACDNYFEVDLNKAQVLEWISDLQKIADDMVAS